MTDATIIKEKIAVLRHKKKIMNNFEINWDRALEKAMACCDEFERDKIKL